jgi:spermidine/putrescine transport system substrate-binding protein
MLKRIAMLAALVLLTGSAWAQKNKLNVYIWSEYIDPAIVAQFEKQFDCKVTIDLYEDNESMMSKLEQGGSSIYDICVPSDYIVPVLIKRKLIQPLRHENVPNLKNVETKFASPPFDPGNKYTAPYQWGTVGLYVREEPGKPVEETWGLIFDAKKQPGSFLLMDSMRECFSGALRYSGQSVNSTEPAVMQKVRDLLLEAKKRSQGFEGGVGGKNKVLAKQTSLAIVYNGDAVRGMNEEAGKGTRYFVPKEGGEIWLDSMCIPAKAPNHDMAEKFINYILDAKVGAQLSNFNQYATPNKAAKEFIKPEDLKNSAIYPPPEMMPKLEFLKDLGRKTRLYDELWTQIKSK